MAERTTVRLPEELVRRAKRHAAAKGTTMTALIEAGLRHELNERDVSARKAHVPLPVSAARGGLMPGVDLTDLSKLQEEEDIEYVARMNRSLR